MAVTIGDMTTTRVPGTFTLVYLVANTTMNVTTQDEQVSVFANAAAHLRPGGCFVVELVVPQVRAVPRGEMGRVFTLDADHIGIETFDDLVGQIAWSHHWMEVQGRLVRHACRTGSCGPRSSISWPASPACACAAAGRIGSVHRSHRTALARWLRSRRRSRERCRSSSKPCLSITGHQPSSGATYRRVLA